MISYAPNFHYVVTLESLKALFPHLPELDREIFWNLSLHVMALLHIFRVSGTTTVSVVGSEGQSCSKVAKGEFYIYMSLKKKIGLKS